MYEQVEKALQSIMQVVEKCPEQFKEKCFEILLSDYLNRLGAPAVGGPIPQQQPTLQKSSPASGIAGQLAQLPPATKTRLGNLGKRIEMNDERFLELFDFTSDEVHYHPIEVPGDSVAEQMRNTALLVATFTYLAGGHWRADWAEARALCLDCNCYDSGNFATAMRAEEGNLFKSVTANEPLELTGPGRQGAEQLLAQLLSQP